MRQIGKIVSLFIVLCMICSAVPMMTMAATNVSTFEELKSAFENGGEVTLTRDIVVTEGLKLSGTVNLVINGGGHIISPAVTGLDELGVVNSDATAIEQIIRIYSGGKLTVNNATIYGGKGRCINNEGELVMNNVSLERAHLVYDESYGYTSGAGIRNKGKASLTNCNIRRNGCDSNGGGFLNALAGSVMVFNNCSVVENRNFTSGMGGGAGENQGILYINNSTFANNQSSEIGGGINNFGGTIYAMNSTFTGNVTTVGYAYYGGAIGINGGNLYAVNSVFAFNQSGAGISDIGLYSLSSTSKVELYNCAYTSVAGNSSNVAKVKTVDCKQISESDVPGDVFDGSRTSGVLDQNGVEQSTTYDRPIIAPLGNGIYGVYLNKNSLLLNGGTDTYFSTGDFSAKMSYKDSNGDIVPLGDCEAAAEEDKVVKYPDGSNRTGNAIGAASDTDTHYTYYVVKINPVPNGTVEGGSAFGNALLEGTPITVKAVPDEGYRFAGWKIGTETSPSVTENPYTFTLSSDITLTPVFEQSAILSLEITNVTDKTRTYGDTVSKDEMTVKAVFNDSTVDENFKDYTVIYEDSAAFLKKGNNKIFVTADGITSAPYVINGVQGKMVTVSMFRITNPQLIYDGNEKIGLIKAAVYLKPEYEGKVGTPSYTIKKDGAVITSVKDAGKYDIYAECAASDEYEAFSAEKLGAIAVGQKSLTNSDFVKGANPVYDGSEKSAPVTTALVKDKDYTVSGTEKLTNVSAADAEIIFIGCGNYKGEIKLNWNLEKAENTNVPPAVGVGVSYNKTDGKITGVDSTMEYSSDNTTWNEITGTEITGLANGTYYVRYKETSTNKASDAVTVIVGAYSAPSSGRGGSRVSYVTVKFETNGGSNVESQSIKKNETAASVSAPTKEGYEFAGWYSDKELTKEFDFSAKITASMTVYAKWNEVKKDEPVEDNSKNEIIFTIGKKAATVFGASKSFDVSPLVRNERTMLPARFVAESLGASVEWNGAKKLVTVKGKHLKTEEEVTILITIGSDIAYVNGAEYKLDTKAFAENNRTYTPLRFISEQLGATVEWKAETQQVIITK